MQVGFVGLGRMGRPMVERLLAAGHAVHVFNRSRAPVDALTLRGARAAGSATEVAQRAEIVLAALPSEEASRQVFDDLARVARRDQIFVDHSTISPELARRCGAELASRGAQYLDAPMSGGPDGAAAGTLAIMVGGDEAAFTRALPVFEAYGKTIRRIGPVGSGEAAKLVNQLLVTLHTAAAAEAMVFAAKLGADPRVVFEVVSAAYAGSRMLERNAPRFLAREFSGAAPIRLFVKDLGLIRDAAARVGMPLPLGSVVLQRYGEAHARGMGEEDMAAMVRLWEEAAAVTVGPSA